MLKSNSSALAPSVEALIFSPRAKSKNVHLAMSAGLNESTTAKLLLSIGLLTVPYGPSCGVDAIIFIPLPLVFPVLDVNRWPNDG